MNAIVILRQHWDDSFCEPTVVIKPIRQRPCQRFTEAELEALPDQFRCYCCNEIHKKRDLGGIELRQRLCRMCYPYLDEWTVGSFIWWDLRRGYPVKG